MNWVKRPHPHEDELLATLQRINESLDYHNQLSRPPEEPKAEALEQAAAKWRRDLRGRVAVHVVLSVGVAFIASVVLVARNGGPGGATFDWQDIASAAGLLDMTTVTALVVSSTALVASVTIAVVVAPLASTVSHLRDRFAAAVWPEAVSWVALLLSVINSGVVLLSLFRPASNPTGGGWLLAPLAVAGASLAVITTTRAQDDAARAWPERRRLQIESRLKVLGDIKAGSSRSWELRWVQVAAGIEVVILVVAVVYFAVQADDGPFGETLWAYLLAVLFIFILVVSVLGLGEALRLVLILHGHRRVAAVVAVLMTAIAAAVAILITYALTVQFTGSTSHPALSALLTAPVGVIAITYVASFVDRTARPRFSPRGGVSAAVRHSLEEKKELNRKLIEARRHRGGAALSTPG